MTEQQTERVAQLDQIVAMLPHTRLMDMAKLVQPLTAWAEADCEVGRPEADYRDLDVLLRWFAGQLILLGTVEQREGVFVSLMTQITLRNTWPRVWEACRG